VEPFAGAAALLFNKVPSKVEVLNDVNAELVNLYRVVRTTSRSSCGSSSGR
jgi:DNA adenine methylase